VKILNLILKILLNLTIYFDIISSYWASSLKEDLMQLIVQPNYDFEESESCPADCCVIDCDFCGIDSVCFVDTN
jgi:hypothetical protein